MTGLFLLVVLGGWLVVVIFVVRAIGRCFKSQVKRMVTTLVSFVLLVVLPFSDEFIGAQQFKSLCRKDGLLKEVDLERARGMRLLVKMDSFKPVSGQILETEVARYAYVDTESGRVMFGFNDYIVRGGWLIRFLGISEVNSPLTFTSNCESLQGERLRDLLNRYQINRI